MKDVHCKGLCNALRNTAQPQKYRMSPRRHRVRDDDGRPKAHFRVAEYFFILNVAL